jgi:hypothetical protein
MVNMGVAGQLDPGNPDNLSGVFLEISKFNTSAQPQVAVADRLVSVPEPGSLALFAMAMMFWHKLATV